MIFVGDISTLDMCRRNHAGEIKLKDVLTKNEGLQRLQKLRWWYLYEVRATMAGLAVPAAKRVKTELKTPSDLWILIDNKWLVFHIEAEKKPIKRSEPFTSQ